MVLAGWGTVVQAPVRAQMYSLCAALSAESGVDEDCRDAQQPTLCMSAVVVRVGVFDSDDC